MNLLTILYHPEMSFGIIPLSEYTNIKTMNIISADVEID